MKAHELFEVLAGKTWRSIERFSRNRIHLGEDAITSNNLDTLASAAPSCIFFEDTRATESTKGCDFELWIGSDALGWRRYAVQAKKIQISSSRYSALNHHVSGVPQIDILDAYAKANRAAPIYCFYNHSTQPHKWNCPLPKQVEQLGCSVTPSSVVRAALAKRGARNFSHIHKQPATLPWRCLVRCPDLLSGRGLGHSSWPAPDSFSHRELPTVLQRIRQGSLSDQHSSEAYESLFNTNHEKRPGWVGLVDVSANNNG